MPGAPALAATGAVHRLGWRHWLGLSWGERLVTSTPLSSARNTPSGPLETAPHGSPRLHSFPAGSTAVEITPQLSPRTRIGQLFIGPGIANEIATRCPGNPSLLHELLELHLLPPLDALGRQRLRSSPPHENRLWLGSDTMPCDPAGTGANNWRFQAAVSR